MIKPITPAQAKAGKQDSIPDFIYEAFNKFIIDNLSISGRSSFKQKKLVEYIIDTAAINGDSLTSGIIFTNQWLDVEAIYEKQGWKVKYESPCIGESFDEYFEFIPK